MPTVFTFLLMSFLKKPSLGNCAVRDPRHAVVYSLSDPTLSKRAHKGNKAEVRKSWLSSSCSNTQVSHSMYPCHSELRSE
ncbi:hypothetical protein J3E69DRAFT_222966 [Trichoderma sp. SZMC 28015]